VTASAAADRALAAGAAAIVEGLRKGLFQRADVVAASRRRLAAAAGLNALVQACDGDAPELACGGDVAAGGLAGVPVSVKECFPVRGLLTTLGIPSRRGPVDATDADVVQRLRRAGAVIVGKGNVPEAMYLHETANPVWGRTVHPLDPGRSPGGSTGGDAALVAAGVVPLAVGTDLAGSLRQPAHACGLSTIMPRTAVLGEGGAFDTVPSLTTVRPRAGFLARNVADLALALEATGGARSVAPRLPERIAWWEETGPIPAASAVRRGVHEAVSRLARRGIQTVRVPATVVVDASWLLLGILSADGGADIRALYERGRPGRGVARLLSIAGFPPRWRPALAAVLRLVGRGIEAEGVRRTGWRTPEGRAALEAERERLARRYADLVDGCDAAICPVSALPAMRHGAAARLVLAAGPCLLANLLDLPAGAVPITAVRLTEQRRRISLDPVLRAAAATDRGSAGLPIGVQVVGSPGRDEATVLEVMRLLTLPETTPP